MSEISSHLERCKNNFIPPLQETVDISSYAEKIKTKSITFEAWDNERLAGLIAVYFNDPGNEFGFITNVSVEKEYAGQGIASRLLESVSRYAREKQFKEIRLKVHCRNIQAIKLYRKHSFEKYGSEEDFDLYHLYI